MSRHGLWLIVSYRVVASGRLNCFAYIQIYFFVLQPQWGESGTIRDRLKKLQPKLHAIQSDRVRAVRLPRVVRWREFQEVTLPKLEPPPANFFKGLMSELGSVYICIFHQYLSSISPLSH